MTQYRDLKGVPLDAYNKCCNLILERAQLQLGLPREEIILRDLRYDDLGTTGKWKFDIDTATAWHTLIDAYAIADNRFICISGMFTEMDDPVIHAIKITRAGSVARWWNVQRVGLQDSHEVHVDDPIVVDQNQTITIEAWNGLSTTSEIEEFGFLGCVAEKRGLVINP